MHTKIPGSGLTSRSRQNPAPCPPARCSLSVVSPAPVPKQPQQLPRHASVAVADVFDGTGRGCSTFSVSRGVVLTSNSSKELHPTPEPFSSDFVPAATNVFACGPESHEIVVSDGSDSEAECAKAAHHRDSMAATTAAAAVPAARNTCEPSSKAASGVSAGSQITQRRQLMRVVNNSNQMTTAAGHLSTSVLANSSNPPSQPQQQARHSAHNHIKHTSQPVMSRAKKLATAATTLVVVLIAISSSSAARSFLGWISTLRSSSSSSSSGALSAAAAAGDYAWGEVGGLWSPAYNAAQYGSTTRPSSLGAGSAAGASNPPAAAASYGSWLSSSHKSARALQYVNHVMIRSLSLAVGNTGSGSGGSGIATDKSSWGRLGLKPSTAAASGSTAVTSNDIYTQSNKLTPAGDLIKMYAVVDDSAVSPYKGATWGSVIRHIAKRLTWNNAQFRLEVLTQQQLKDDSSARDSLAAALSGSHNSKSSPIFVGIAVTDPDVAAFLRQATAALPTALFWDTVGDLDQSTRVDGFNPATASPFAQLLAQKVGFSGEARASKVLKTIDSLWGRHTSDDLLFIWLVLLNEYVTPVPEVANTTKGTDLQSLICMIKNCGNQIKECVTDTRCKAGLDCLDGCAFNDQVCQYRCIVSYETPKFEQFALCILQLHNCRGLDAKMPTTPDPAPMTTWRGQAITHEVAESLFIGWKELGMQMPEGAQVKPYSWLVAAGKNPAYDFFPCQHQLYSYGKGKGQMWYEPVFQAITLDGQEVWRRRRYRVRRGPTPGTFYYSVLDNGVTSNEYWRIMDCAEDLTYCLFYYSGAAAAAGLSYSGAVLATKDGLWPTAYTERIHEALGRAGIEPWELSTVDNSACAGAPL